MILFQTLVCLIKEHGIRDLREAFRHGFDYQSRIDGLQTEVAERSLEFKDVFSLPSLTSIGGLALVAYGSRRLETLEGVTAVAVGRGFDLVDGFLSRALDQESDMGGAIDAGADKIAMALIARAAWKKHLVPRHVLIGIAVSNTVNAALSTCASLKHPDASLRPTAEGKHSMALLNGSIMSFAYASALGRERPELEIHDTLNKIGELTFAAGSVYAAVAAQQYARRI